MRISDLSRQTGVPVATIKFYLREGLLPPGRPTGRNQAEYGDAHKRRLRLIRAFTNIAQLDLSSVRELLIALEKGLPLPDLYQIADRALFPEQPASSDPHEVEQTRAAVDDFIDGLGWKVRAEAPGRDRLAHVLAALQRLGCGCRVDFFTPYAEAAERLAVRELDLLGPDDTDIDRAAAMVRAILLEVALAALRRMAQEHHTAIRFGHTTSDVQPV